MTDVTVTFSREEAEVVRAILNDSAISFAHMLDQGDHNLEQRVADAIGIDLRPTQLLAQRAWRMLDRKLEEGV